MMRMEENVAVQRNVIREFKNFGRAFMPTDDVVADRVLNAAVHSAIDLIREGHDPYWTLLHAGLAAEPLVAA